MCRLINGLSDSDLLSWLFPLIAPFLFLPFAGARVFSSILAKVAARWAPAVEGEHTKRQGNNEGGPFYSVQSVSRQEKKKKTEKGVNAFLSPESAVFSVLL